MVNPTEQRLASAQAFTPEPSRPSPPSDDDLRNLADKIYDRIDTRFQAWDPMVQRMERSMDKWRMKPYIPPVKEAIDLENAYTSRLDGVLARKVVYSIAAGEPQVRIENDAAWRNRATANENAERFAIGCLNIGNDLLRDEIRPTLQKQLAWFATVRGAFVACRGLLNKDPLTGETYPDWFVLDPRNVVYSRRSKGVRWIAHRFERTRAEIREQYPNFQFTEYGEDPYVPDDERTTEVCYDYYERIDIPIPGPDGNPVAVVPRYYNGTLIMHRWARLMMDTQAEDWPITIVPVGYMPELGTQNPVVDQDTMVDFGEDVFALTDGITDSINLTMSYAQQAIAQQVHRAYKKMGAGGGPDVADHPSQPGVEVNLDTDAEQDLEFFQPADIGAAPQVLLGNGQAEWYAAGLTAHALGQMPPGGLSGAALRLVGSNIGERSHPFLGPVELCIEGCLTQMLKQFAAGGYGPLQVYGKSLSGAPFDRPINAQDVQGHGRLTFKLNQTLPEDVYEKWAIAQMATRVDPVTKKSLVPLDWGQSHLLGIEDTSLMNQKQDVERVKEMMPVITLLDWRQSSMERGEWNAVQYLDTKIAEEFGKDRLTQLVLWYQLMQAGGAGSMMELMQIIGGMTQGGTEGAARNISSNGQGVDPRLSSVENERPGTVGQNPSPEAGVNSPMPRPGAQRPGLEDAGLITASRFGAPL